MHPFYLLSHEVYIPGFSTRFLPATGNTAGNRWAGPAKLAAAQLTVGTLQARVRYGTPDGVSAPNYVGALLLLDWAFTAWPEEESAPQVSVQLRRDRSAGGPVKAVRDRLPRIRETSFLAKLPFSLTNRPLNLWKVWQRAELHHWWSSNPNASASCRGL